ncbi:TPA: hypothetical protein PW370_002381, partial [Mannheimia haemolytica]|nr:hypothetical protein [Mannheimia haemolytica]
MIERKILSIFNFEPKFMLTTLIPLSQLNLPPNLQNSEQIQPLVTAISLSNFVHQTLQKQPDLLAEWLAKFP